MAKAETQSRKLTIDVDDERRVSGLLMLPADASALYVLAHGAGAGMAHPFLETMARALAERKIGTLRFQFPYMEAGSRRPDSPAVAHAAIRAAVIAAADAAPGLPLIAGGKSFGGRMTSQAQASEPLPGVVSLAFLGFPLHPPGKPGIERADHLADVRIPMLFLQGTRDEFAELTLLQPLAKRLGKRTTLHLVDAANHSFKVPAKTGRKDAEVRAELADTIATWTAQVIGG
jgi:predicted alpha/beta-hydrolase family hydrolase